MKLLQIFSKIKWRYIFGELSLIVLGILIALFINNLNEKRKVKIFENNIITEIEKSLSRDKEFHLENRIVRGEKIIASSEILLKYLDKEMEYHDSLETHFWRMSWILIFEPQTIPFERLKSKGIETLSNEKARVKLLQLYDYTYPRLSYFTENYNNWSSNTISPFSIKNFLIKNLEKGKGYQPIDKEFLQNNIEYRNLVLEKNSRTKSLLGRMARAKSRVENLIKDLE